MNQITINGWCKQCGICEAFCPKRVFDFRPGHTPTPARPEDCTGCGLCGLRCPDFAITVEKEAAAT